MLLSKLRDCVRWPSRLARNDSGVTSIELAFTAPIFLMLLLGTVDMVGYIMTANKINRTAAQTADSVTRYKEIRDIMLLEEDDDDGQESAVVGLFFAAANEIAQPIELPENGRVILSSVSNTDGTGPRITWQRTGDYDLNVDSEIGMEGEIADLPDEFTLHLYENAIVAEVFYEFRPITMVGAFIGDNPDTVVQLRRMAIFRPRFGSLATLAP